MITIFGWKLNSKVFIANALVLLISIIDYLQSNLDGAASFIPAPIYHYMPFWLPMLSMALRVYFPNIQPLARKGVSETVTDVDTAPEATVTDTSVPDNSNTTPSNAPAPGYISLPVGTGPNILVPVETVQAILDHGVPAVTQLVETAIQLSSDITHPTVPGAK